MRNVGLLRSSTLLAPALVLCATLAAASGCGTILSLTDDDGGTDGADATTDAPASPQDGGLPGDGRTDGPPPVPCAPMITPTDALLCVPRFIGDAGAGVGDGAAPFLSGAYAFDKSNAGLDPAGLPATQRATLYVSWDFEALYFFGSMQDANAVTDTGNPQLEFMACAGDPDSDYDETQCVDFFVSYTNVLSGAGRFDTSKSGITNATSGSPTGFTVIGRVPAKHFGTLASGKRLSINMNAVSYQRPDAGLPVQQSSMSAFFFRNRTCRHDGGSGGFACGGNDQSYEPVTWARMVLH